MIKKDFLLCRFHFSKCINEYFEKFLLSFLFASIISLRKKIKFFVARKVDEGVPYYVGQHGNNYFTAICFNHMYELKTCDKFISWGGKYESNVVPTFNFKTLGKKRLFKKDGNLTVICDNISVPNVTE